VPDLRALRERRAGRGRDRGREREKEREREREREREILQTGARISEDDGWDWGNQRLQCNLKLACGSCETETKLICFYETCVCNGSQFEGRSFFRKRKNVHDESSRGRCCCCRHHRCRDGRCCRRAFETWILCNFLSHGGGSHHQCDGSEMDCRS